MKPVFRPPDRVGYVPTRQVLLCLIVTSKGFWNPLLLFLQETLDDIPPEVLLRNLPETKRSCASCHSFPRGLPKRTSRWGLPAVLANKVSSSSPRVSPLRSRSPSSFFITFFFLPPVSASRPPLTTPLFMMPVLSFSIRLCSPLLFSFSC